MAKNYGALNIVFCGLDSNEFNCVSAHDTAKEIRSILETTFEGTSQVREFKISPYVH